MKIEVVFALPALQVLREIDVAEGATVEDAIATSGLAHEFPQTDFGSLQAGVWGTPRDRDHTLRKGDRVELYRSLEMDPREARRRKAGGA